MSREIPKTVQYPGAAPSVADAKRAVESCLDTSSSHHHSLAPELASVRDRELRHLDLSGPVASTVQTYDIGREWTSTAVRCGGPFSNYFGAACFWLKMASSRSASWFFPSLR